MSVYYPLCLIVVESTVDDCVRGLHSSPRLQLSPSTAIAVVTTAMARGTPMLLMPTQVDRGWQEEGSRKAYNVLLSLDVTSH